MTNSVNIDSRGTPFYFERPVAYYETDAMGVVHHSNYVRYFEDARVDWMRTKGLIDYHAPKGAFVFAVRKLHCEFLRPLRFGDTFKVAVWARLDGVKIELEYEITCGETKVATGATMLVPLDAQFRPARLPASARALFLER